MNIGTLAERTGLSVRTIRFYESVGLINPAARTPGNFRIYGEAELRTLCFIRNARRLGFSVLQIRHLLSLRAGGHGGKGAVAIAEGYLHELSQKLARLQHAADAMRSMLVEAAGAADPDQALLERIAVFECDAALEDPDAEPRS